MKIQLPKTVEIGKGDNERWHRITTVVLAAAGDMISDLRIETALVIVLYTTYRLTSKTIVNSATSRRTFPEHSQTNMGIPINTEK
jgi:hypothetical protein